MAWLPCQAPNSMSRPRKGGSAGSENPPARRGRIRARLSLGPGSAFLICPVGTPEGFATESCHFVDPRSICPSAGNRVRGHVFCYHLPGHRVLGPAAAAEAKAEARLAAQSLLFPFPSSWCEQDERVAVCGAPIVPATEEASASSQPLLR